MRLFRTPCVTALLGALLLAGCATQTPGLRYESGLSSSSVRKSVAVASETRQKQSQQRASKQSARANRIASLQARGVKPAPKSNSKLSAVTVDRKKNPTANAKITPKGSYIDYKQGVIGGGKAVVLFFYSPLSPKSESDDKMLRVWYMGDDRPELSVYKVDFATAEDLKQRYKVLEDHTYVKIDPRGKMLSRLFSPSAGDLRDFLRSPFAS